MEVLEKPQYKRLIVGRIQGEESVFAARVPGDLSKVPYGEPTWLADGYYSPYYTEVGHTSAVIAIWRNLIIAVVRTIASSERRCASLSTNMSTQTLRCVLRNALLYFN